MKKKIARLLLIVILTGTLSGCGGCDSPAKMMSLYKQCRAESPDTMRALGKYFALYGYDYYLSDKSERNVSWDKTVSLCDTMKYIPKLTDTVDTVEYFSDHMYLYYKVPDDFETFIGDLQKKLFDAGFGQTSYKEDKKKNTYSLDLGMETPEGASDKKFLRVYIDGYPQKYSASHNISVSIYFSNY